MKYLAVLIVLLVAVPARADGLMTPSPIADVIYHRRACNKACARAERAERLAYEVRMWGVRKAAKRARSS